MEKTFTEIAIKTVLKSIFRWIFCFLTCFVWAVAVFHTLKGTDAYSLLVQPSVAARVAIQILMIGTSLLVYKFIKKTRTLVILFFTAILYLGIYLFVYSQLR